MVVVVVFACPALPFANWERSEDHHDTPLGSRKAKEEAVGGPVVLASVVGGPLGISPR